MSFFLDLIEGSLGLTEQEKAEIAPALPELKAIIDVVNAHMDDWWALGQHFIQEQPTIRQLFSDFRVVGPAISELLGDGNIDIGAVTSAGQNIAATWKVDPNAPAIESLLRRLQPAFHTIAVNWPKAKPALVILVAALQRKHLA